MDQHPVPQNVTTFQFRLIGDMTIKQFGHLAGGAILAYISYKLPLPFFFSWPLTIIFALGGIGFAFVPIEERPMDVWVLSFLKNVYSPTIYVWERSPSVITPVVSRVQPVHPSAPVIAPRQQPSPPAVRPPLPQGQMAAQVHPTQPVAQKSAASVVNTMYAAKLATGQQYTSQGQLPQQQAPGMFDWLSSLFWPKTRIQIPQPTPQQAPHMATPSVVGNHLDMSTPPAVAKQPINTPPRDSEEKKEKLDEKLSVLKHELEDHSISQARILELQKQLTEVLMQKDIMAAEMQAMQKQLNTVAAPQSALPVRPTIPSAQQQQVPQPTPQQKQPTVKIITPEGAVRAGLPRLTTFPNVVTGITKDSDNNLLPGVLVTVKDKDGVPVRALKTNRLGQFAASTPLSNGVYFVEIEDPRQRYTFDRVQITLNGSIVPALEIITKSQKQISRDKLAKELFGNTA